MNPLNLVFKCMQVQIIAIDFHNGCFLLFQREENSSGPQGSTGWGGGRGTVSSARDWRCHKISDLGQVTRTFSLYSSRSILDQPSLST